jgi:hypothetical protein
MWKAISMTLLAIIAIQVYVVVQYRDSISFSSRLSNNNQSNNNVGFDPAHEGTSGSLYKGLKYRSFPINNTIRQFDQYRDSKVKQIWEQLPKGDKSCVNWGVVTTIFAPTNAIKAVAKVKGYCVVIVTDKKTPTPYDGGERTVVLTVEDQQKLAAVDLFVSKLPWNHFGRKNIGFMYAIFRKAQFIFDFDDDNELVPDNTVLKPLQDAVRFKLNSKLF